MISFVATSGLLLSTTATVAVFESVLPLASVTVKVTVFTPRFEQVKLVLSNTIVATEQLSVEPLSICAAVIVALPVASR